METHRSFSPVFIQHFILVLMPPFNFVVLQAQEGKCLVGKNLFLCVATDLDAARNSIDKALETMGEQASPDMFTIPIFPVARRVDGPRMTDSFKAHAARLHTKYQGSKPDNSEAPKPSANARWNSKRKATVVIYNDTEFSELSPTAKKPAVVKQGSQVIAATAATLSSITAESLKQAVHAAVQVALVPTQQAFAALQLGVSSMREILEAHAKTQVLHAQTLANLTQPFQPSQQPPNARPRLPAPPRPMSNQPTFQEPPLPPDLKTIPPAPATTEPVHRPRPIVQCAISLVVERP